MSLEPGARADAVRGDSGSESIQAIAADDAVLVDNICRLFMLTFTLTLTSAMEEDNANAVDD